MSPLRKVKMVKGPAKVTVRGRCMVLGADVSDSVVAVRAGKALPFEPEPYCRFGMKMGQGARVWDASPFSAGSSIWKSVPRAVLSAVEQQGKLTVLVMGNVDTGKSTFCTYLANTAIKRGVAPCIIDGDIGQGDIAPPSAMGAAVLTKQLTDLRDATASLFGFVGNISPAGIEQLVEDALYNLSLRSRNLAPLVIINTDGYAHDSGIKYKRMIADKIQPDMLILIGRNQPLEIALASNSWRLIKARSSGQALKSWTERRWRRHNQFLRFVGEGQIRMSLDRMEFSYLSNTLSSSDLASISTTDFDLGLRDLFVGLGLNGVVVGFGVIRNIGRDFVELQTDLHYFDAIRLSNIRLTGGEAEQITVEMPGRVSQEN
jgi:polynucleotide 5'-hydroxyl-kinase GRC3/NOL9